MPNRPRVLIPTPSSIDVAYNRQCWPQYADAVVDAGGDPIAADLGVPDLELRVIARGCSGVALPGSLADLSPELYGRARDPRCGPSDKARERCDWTLLDHAFETGTPLLAICYGMQSLNVFRGGTLLQDIDVQAVRHTAGAGVETAHTVEVSPGSRLSGFLDSTEGSRTAGGTMSLAVNSSHHQAADLVGSGLRVVARSATDGVIEGLELEVGQTAFLLGVQWHPERTTAVNAMSRRIFEGLVEAARAHAAIEMPTAARR